MTIRSLRRTRLLLTLPVLFAVALPHALAQDNYPSRPLRIIVPSAPGGSSDIGARLIAQRLSERWGRPVVVENRAGAGTIIGNEMVARAPPDGYTLLMAPGALATIPATYKKVPYDAVRDFAPITQTLFVPNLIVVHPSLPAKSVKELIALAKARPGEILYADKSGKSRGHSAGVISGLSTHRISYALALLSTRTRT